MANPTLSKAAAILRQCKRKLPQIEPGQMYDEMFEQEIDEMIEWLENLEKKVRGKAA
jgi:hypothetical protein